MYSLAKARTFLGLLARGEVRRIQGRWHYNRRLLRLKREPGTFVYRDGLDRLVCDPGLHDSASAFLEPSTDICEREVIHAWLQPGDAVIDAGANVGLYSIVSAECVGHSGKVLAIEPTPRLVAHLRMAAQKLGHHCIEVMEAAVSDRTGEAAFAFAPAEATTVSQSLVSTVSPGAAERTGIVHVETLRTIFEQSMKQRDLTLVKLDIEGAELQALRAAPEAWRSPEGPLWIVECHPEALGRFGVQRTQIFELFSSADFDRWIIGKYAAPGGGDLPPERLDESRIPEASFHNMIAIPRGRKWAARRKRVERRLHLV